MTITITGSNGEFLYNIVTYGENCSIIESDKDGIKWRQGKVAIKGDNKEMVKIKIIETTEKYDKDGKLVEKITREETTEDDTVYESGAAYYSQEPAKSCCEYKCELNGKDVIEAINDYAKRIGNPLFCF